MPLHLHFSGFAFVQQGSAETHLLCVHVKQDWKVSLGMEVPKAVLVVARREDADVWGYSSCPGRRLGAQLPYWPVGEDMEGIPDSLGAHGIIRVSNFLPLSLRHLPLPRNGSTPSRTVALPRHRGNMVVLVPVRVVVSFFQELFWPLRFACLAPSSTLDDPGVAPPNEVGPEAGNGFPGFGTEYRSWSFLKATSKGSCPMCKSLATSGPTDI